MKKAVVLISSLDGCYEFAYFKQSLKYEIVDIVLPIKSSLSGRDIGVIYETNPIGMTLSVNVDYSQDFMSMIIPQSLDNSNIDFMLPLIEAAINNGKEIITDSENITMINSKILLTGKLSNFCEISNEPLNFSDKIYEHETPIILVAGIHEKTNKFIIQLEMQQYIKDKGYKVSQIGTKKYSSLFGMHSFPDFMFESNNEHDKIHSFNMFIRKIEKAEQPDVIILGVPGGIMPFSAEFPGFFGITMFEVMQAVKPDALVVGCLFDEYIPAYFENMIQGIKAKYSADIDGFNISDFKVDVNASEEAKKLHYNKVSSKSIDRMISEIDIDIPIYNVLNQADGYVMAEHILSKLETYSDAEII